MSDKEERGRQAIEQNTGRLVREGVPVERAREIARQVRMTNENPGRRDRWLREDRRKD